MTTQFDYDAFDRATGHMTAFAITRGGESVGRVVIKPGRDGAARLTAYAQVWGAPMVKGTASGFGYDKRGAALSQALQRLPANGGGMVPEGEQTDLERLREIGRPWPKLDTSCTP